MTNFDYQGKKYQVEPQGNGTSYTFYELPAGRGPTRLFVAEMPYQATVKDFKDELGNRASQRQSAVKGNFHLNPSERMTRKMNAFENGRAKALNAIEAKLK